MRIVVNTPSGNVGAAVVERLLASPGEVVIISRHPAKVAGAVARGARLVEGSLDDPRVLEPAFAGADALLWVTPISFAPADYMEWARGVGRMAAEVAQRAGIRRAVLVSSLGADHELGVGPVGCLPAIERAFAEAVPEVTALRPGAFMENFLSQAAGVAGTGTIFGRYPATRKVPWIATRDVAERAADLLLTVDRAEGLRVLELHGAEDASASEIASIVGEVLDRPIQYVEVDEAQARAGLQQAGVPEKFAELLLEMYAGYLAGRMERTQPRSAATTTRTTWRAFARERFAPAIVAAGEDVRAASVSA